MEKIFKRQNEICTVWKAVNKYNRDLANVALKEGKIKRSGFLFYAYLLLEGQFNRGEYSAHEVGSFQNIEDCQNAEKVFLKYDYATKPCREWNPMDLSSVLY